MSYFRPHTKRGYNLFEVASCLQKAIRRGDAALAGYMAIEMFESGYALYVWKRLLTVSAEDCAGIITQEIKALFESWRVASDDGKKQTRVFLAKAVILLCQCPKSRDADHLVHMIYSAERIDGDKLLALVEESRANPENIPLPEYTFDVHTTKGKRRGKTKADFMIDEFKALQPRAQGLFDYTVQRPETNPTEPND